VQFSSKARLTKAPRARSAKPRRIASRCWQRASCSPRSRSPPGWRCSGCT